MTPRQYVDGKLDESVADLPRQILIITRETDRSVDRASINIPVSNYRFVTGTISILSEPITWAAVAILFLGQLAKSAGESSGKIVGDALGNWIAERLGLSSYTSRGRFEQYLNEIVSKFSAIVHQELIDHELRTLNADLAGLSNTFQQHMLAKDSQTIDVMSTINGKANDLYSGFIMKGGIGLLGLMRAGCIRIAACACLFDLTKDEGWKINALNSIKEIVSDVKALLEQVRKNYDKRIVVSNDERSVPCRYPDPDSSRKWETEYMPVYYTIISVDGQKFEYIHDGNPCRGESKLEMPLAAKERELVAKAFIDEEFLDKFIVPFQLLEKVAEEAKSAVCTVTSGEGR